MQIRDLQVLHSDATRHKLL